MSLARAPLLICGIWAALGIFAPLATREDSAEEKPLPSASVSASLAASISSALALVFTASVRKYTVSEGMSLFRSRRGGVWMVMTARR